MGRSYSVQLIASEVRAIDKWEVTSGELPDGMSLTKTGLLSGTPKAAGDYEFDITVSMIFPGSFGIPEASRASEKPRMHSCSEK